MVQNRPENNKVVREGKGENAALELTRVDTFPQCLFVMMNREEINVAQRLVVMLS